MNKIIETCCKTVEDRLDGQSANKALSGITENEDYGGQRSIDKLEYEDILDELNAVYIQSQNFAVYYFAEMIGEFSGMFDKFTQVKVTADDSNRKLVTKARNLADLITRDKPLGKFRFLIDQSANRFTNFMKSYQILLRIGIEMDKVANENSSFSIGIYLINISTPNY